jgi:hypothetical protein
VALVHCRNGRFCLQLLSGLLAENQFEKFKSELQGDFRLYRCLALVCSFLLKTFLVAFICSVGSVYRENALASLANRLAAFRKRRLISSGCDAARNRTRNEGLFCAHPRHRRLFRIARGDYRRSHAKAGWPEALHYTQAVMAR